jgi:hypothetical protein
LLTPKFDDHQIFPRRILLGTTAVYGKKEGIWASNTIKKQISDVSTTCVFDDGGIAGSWCQGPVHYVCHAVSAIGIVVGYFAVDDTGIA